MTEYVVLVDERDNEIGTAEKLRAHQQGGQLHRAFSIFIFDTAGRLLIQRRAPTKYHYAGLWANTCCSHPRPGELLLDAACRKLQQEMGFVTELRPVLSFVYHATDDHTGLTEHEYDHVLLGSHDRDPRINPSEADMFRWAAVDELVRDLARQPHVYTPWFRIALAALLERGLT
ncbi:MAG: isopentenyl-diphosphate Delta-isomerase [Planctomycetota bacterium]